MVITCRMLLPSDQPANWSGVPSWATALLGALTSRWKPSTPVDGARRTDWYAIDHDPQSRRRRRQADLRLPGPDGHDLARRQAVGVGRRHLDLVRRVCRGLPGPGDRERTGTSGQRAHERMEVRAVVQPDLGLDVGVVEVEPCSIGGERVVGDRVAGPIQLTFRRSSHDQVGRDSDLDHYRLRTGVVACGRDGEAGGVDTRGRVGLGRIRLAAGRSVTEVPLVAERVAVRIMASDAREVDRERLEALGLVGISDRHRQMGRSVVGDAVEGAGPVGEVVERAVRSDLQVDDAARLGVEVTDVGDVAVWVEVGGLDETLGVVAEEEVPLILRREHVTPVDRATGDGGAVSGVRIGVEGVDVARTCHRTHAFVHGPAVVAALDDAVHLLPREVADVAAVEPPGRAVELEPPRVAEPVRPDRAELAGLSCERVVGRYRAVPVDPKDLPVRVAEVLGVGSVAVVADREVELAVGPEADAPADMQQG